MARVGRCLGSLLSGHSAGNSCRVPELLRDSPWGGCIVLGFARECAYLIGGPLVMAESGGIRVMYPHFFKMHPQMYPRVPPDSGTLRRTSVH